MPQIFISKSGASHGPYVIREIPRLVQEGQFTWDDPAWHEGMVDWQPLHQTFERVAAHEPPLQAAAAEEEEPPAFWSALPRAFLYPLRGPYAVFILGFGGLMVLVQWMSALFILFGLIGYFLIGGYYIAFLFKVVRETALGEDDLVEFPAVGDLWDDVLKPLLQVMFIMIVCVLPSVLVEGFYGGIGEEMGLIPQILLFVGLFYMPMALLCTAIFNSSRTGINPLLVVPAIGRIFFRYLVVFALLAATVIGKEILDETLLEQARWFIAIPVIAWLGFYIGIVQAHVLGLLYRTSARKLGWFNH